MNVESGTWKLQFTVEGYSNHALWCHHPDKARVDMIIQTNTQDKDSQAKNKNHEFYGIPPPIWEEPSRSIWNTHT